MNTAPSPNARAGILVTALAAAGVLAPLFAWSSATLDDVRLDQGVLAFAALAAVLALVLIGRRAPAPPPGSLLLYLGLGCGLLPLLFVPWPQSEAGLADRAVLLSAWALAGVAASSLLDAERLLRWILLGCAAASLYSLLTGIGFDPLGWKPWPEAPPVAPYTGLNQAAELLTPLLTAAVLLLPRPRQQPLSWIAVGICAVHAGTFGTLAGRAALAAGLGLGAWRQAGARWGASFVAGMFLLGELVRAGFAAPTAPPPDAAALPPSMLIREQLYLAAAQRVPGTPLGIGLGRFEADYPEWRSEAEARLSTNDWQSKIYRSPKSLHNDPLQLVLECGWLGGALLLAALLLIVRPAPRWFFAPLLAFGVHALVRAPLLDNPPALALFALLCGLAARASAQLLARAEPRRSRLAGVLLVTGALAAAVPARGQILGELRVANALSPEGSDAATALAKATEVRPWDARTWELRGLGYLAVQQWEFARRCFNHALEHQPSDVGALTGLIQVEMSAPDGDQKLGQELLARAEQLAVHHPAVRAARAAWLDAVSQAHRSEGEARRQSRRPEAGSFLLSAELAGARARLLQDDLPGARLALERAAAFAGAHRALVERLARRADLDDRVLQQLTERIFPGWPADLRAAPPE